MGHYRADFEGIPAEDLEKKKKARKYNSKLISDILKETTLKERLKILNEMMVINLLVDVGIIDSGFWTDEKEKKFRGLINKEAKRLTNAQLKTVKDWEKDGRPK